MNLSYIDRMESEKNELMIKRAKLEVALVNPKDKLSDKELRLMKWQSKIMKEYIWVLEERIKFALSNE